MIESIRALLDSLAVSFDLPVLDWIAANLWCPVLDAVMPVITLLGDAGISGLPSPCCLFLPASTAKPASA